MGLVDLTCLLAWLLPGLLGFPTPIWWASSSSSGGDGEVMIRCLSWSSSSYFLLIRVLFHDQMTQLEFGLFLLVTCGTRGTLVLSKGTLILLNRNSYFQKELIKKELIKKELIKKELIKKELIKKEHSYY